MKTVLNTLHWLLTLALLSAVLVAGNWAWEMYRWARPHIQEVEVVLRRMDQIEKTLGKLKVPGPWSPFKAEASEVLPPLTDAENSELDQLLMDHAGTDPDTPWITERCFDLLQRRVANRESSKVIPPTEEQSAGE